VIRAAAVSALAAFANGVPSLKRSLLHLLRKCLDDSDDEVRERAYFYIVMIEKDLQDSVLDERLSYKDERSDAPDEEMDELKEFAFDFDTNINVDALQEYLTSNKDQLLEQEEEVAFELPNLVQKGDDGKKLDSHSQLGA